MQVAVRPGDRVAMPPAWLWVSGGHPHPITVEGLYFSRSRKSTGLRQAQPERVGGVCSIVTETDYYELLGVDRGADAAAIKSAYRREAMECHPDRHGGCTEKEAHFKAISQAYEVLKDPQKRAAYDRFGHAAFQNGGGGADPFAAGGFDGFSDIFSSIFGEFMDPRGQRQNAARGADLRYDLELTLEEAFAGVGKDIQVEAHWHGATACDGHGSRGDAKPARCASCNGAGKVRANQGFFVVERMCPTCGGSGQVIADPCRSCDGEGRALKRRKLHVDIPAGCRRRDEDSCLGRRRSGTSRRGERRPLSIRPHGAPFAIFQREATNLVADAPISFSHCRARRVDPYSGDRRSEDRDQDSGRHPVGRNAAPSRRWNERVEQPRPRRSGDSHPGRDSDEIVEGAKSDPRAISRHRDWR